MYQDKERRPLSGAFLCPVGHLPGAVARCPAVPSLRACPGGIGRLPVSRSARSCWLAPERGCRSLRSRPIKKNAPYGAFLRFEEKKITSNRKRKQSLENRTNVRLLFRFVNLVSKRINHRNGFVRVIQKLLHLFQIAIAFERIDSVNFSSAVRGNMSI